MIPIKAATTRIDPATVPPIAPPLISVVSVDCDVGEGAAIIVVLPGAFVPKVELVVVTWPKGTTPGVVVVNTDLSYFTTFPHPRPIELPL